MALTLDDIRFIVERDIQDYLDVKSVVDWSNLAQNDFMLRVYIPDTYDLAINTTDYVYTVPSDMRKIRMIRRQSDLDQDINRPYNPVYTLYNGEFSVPAPFGTADTLVIDYYRYLRFFTTTSDSIDLDDRYFPLYSSYIEMRWFRLPSTIQKVGLEQATLKYNENQVIYNATKKQVTDSYTIDIGIQKPLESGW